MFFWYFFRKNLIGWKLLTKKSNSFNQLETRLSLICQPKINWHQFDILFFKYFIKLFFCHLVRFNCNQFKIYREKTSCQSLALKKKLDEQQKNLQIEKDRLKGNVEEIKSQEEKINKFISFWRWKFTSLCFFYNGHYFDRIRTEYDAAVKERTMATSNFQELERKDTKTREQLSHERGKGKKMKKSIEVFFPKNIFFIFFWNDKNNVVSSVLFSGGKGKLCNFGTSNWNWSAGCRSTCRWYWKTKTQTGFFVKKIFLKFLNVMFRIPKSKSFWKLKTV